ncbi:hypothetical protein XENOCAPTIV_015767 [Xenoophorus captivus]|uniref:Prolactin receptor n=1 Tax=Xenoophorus captivus TaxID=1517983 RepID=A0ABV0RQX2_9TELE
MRICNSRCEEPQTCPQGPEVDTEEIGATDIKAPQSTRASGGPLLGLPHLTSQPATGGGSLHSGMETGRPPKPLVQTKARHHPNPNDPTSTPAHNDPQPNLVQ